MDIGFIGVGQMGSHMARRLIEAGHRVLVADTNPEAVGRLAALGAQARDCPRAIADEADIHVRSSVCSGTLLSHPL